MQKLKTNIRRWYYHAKHQYFTLNNAVLLIAFLIAISWAWGAVSTMQRNYELQRKVDARERELRLTELEVQTLEYQSKYYASEEYLDLAARQSLGLADKGEKLLILPANTDAAKKYDKETSTDAVAAAVDTPSNFEQWLTFLMGGNSQNTSE